MYIYIYIHPYVKHILDMGRALARPLPGHAWRYSDLWKEKTFYKCKSVGRLGHGLLEIIQRFEQNEPMVAWATAIQLWTACHQFALDAGSWKTAWVLTLLEDPFEVEEFGGTEEELSITAGFLRSKADLKSLNLGAPAGRNAGHELEEVPEGEERPPFKPRLRPKAEPKKPP